MSRKDRTTIAVSNAAAAYLRERAQASGSVAKALDALIDSYRNPPAPQPLATPGIVVPPPAPPEQGCRCDGTPEPGWWHKRSCVFWREA